MAKKYKNVKRYFGIVSRALFQNDSTLSYERTIEAINRLAEEVIEVDHDEDMWYVGEFTCPLDSVIVGAYWFFSDYHGGQFSKEYKVLSLLGDIFKPGMTSGPEDETSEKDVYEALERIG